LPQLASLFLNDGVTAMRLLFHLPHLNPLNDRPTFSLGALGIFTPTYFFFLVITFGT
jgi:hypothetical protein